MVLNILHTTRPHTKHTYCANSDAQVLTCWCESVSQAHVSRLGQLTLSQPHSCQRRALPVCGAVGYLDHCMSLLVRTVLDGVMMYLTQAFMLF